MNRLPPRPDMAQFDELVIPPEHPEFSDIGRDPRFIGPLPVLVLFILGFAVAAGFIWAFVRVLA